MLWKHFSKLLYLYKGEWCILGQLYFRFVLLPGPRADKNTSSILFLSQCPSQTLLMVFSLLSVSMHTHTYTHNSCALLLCWSAYNTVIKGCLGRRWIDAEMSCLTRAFVICVGVYIRVGVG